MKSTSNKSKQILTDLSFWAFFVWEMLYFMVFNRAIRVDHALLQYKVAHFFYNDGAILLIILLMFLRTILVSEKKERMIRGICMILFAGYVYGYYEKFGYLFERSNVLTFALLICATHFSNDSIMKIACLTQGILAALRISLSLLGHSTDYGWVWHLVQEQDYGRGLVEARYRFGYYHPNDFHMVYMIFIACTLYLVRNSKHRYSIAGISVILNQIFYHFTLSRSGHIGVLALIILYLILPPIYHRSKLWLRKGYSILIACIPFICTAITLSVASTKHFRDIPWMNRLNNMLTNRIGYMDLAYRTSSISLLGGPLEVKILDARYLHLLLQSGLIAFVVYMALHLLLIYWLNKEEDYALFGMVVALDFYLLINGQFLNLQTNIIIYLMLLMSNSIFPKVIHKH